MKMRARPLNITEKELEYLIKLLEAQVTEEAETLLKKLYKIEGRKISNETGPL